MVARSENRRCRHARETRAGLVPNEDTAALVENEGRDRESFDELEREPLRAGQQCA